MSMIAWIEYNIPNNTELNISMHHITMAKCEQPMHHVHCTQFQQVLDFN